MTASSGVRTSRSEEFQFSGDTLLAKIKEIIRAGNIRRVVIKNEDGRVLIDIPLTIGVVGTLLAPQLAAIGAIAALVLKGSIVIEKETPPAPTPRDRVRCESRVASLDRVPGGCAALHRPLPSDEYLLAVTHDLPPAAKEALQRIDGTAAATARGARLSPRRADNCTRAGAGRRTKSAPTRPARNIASCWPRSLRCARASKRRIPATRCTRTRRRAASTCNCSAGTRTSPSASSLTAARGRRARAGGEPIPRIRMRKRRVRFADFLRAWRPVPAAAPLAAPGLSLHGRSRAIDFQIVQNGRIIAPTEVAKVRSVWEGQGWASKLAAAMRDTRFVGPLQSPNEPWHYEYAPRARAGGAKE